MPPPARAAAPRAALEWWGAKWCRSPLPATQLRRGHHQRRHRCMTFTGSLEQGRDPRIGVPSSQKLRPKTCRRPRSTGTLCVHVRFQLQQSSHRLHMPSPCAAASLQQPNVRPRPLRNQSAPSAPPHPLHESPSAAVSLHQQRVRSRLTPCSASTLVVSTCPPRAAQECSGLCPRASSVFTSAPAPPAS
jgi:hypothetical protein